MRTHRLLWQLGFAVLAAVCVAALSVLLITEAVSHAERVVVGETSQALMTANGELRQQYRYRVSSDQSWSVLPTAAKEVSLRGITLTVLRSYPGVEGGFYGGNAFLGYAFPTHYRGYTKTDVPAPEQSEIQAICKRSLATGAPQQRTLQEGTELVVMRALPDKALHIAIWSMKRLPGQGPPGAWRRQWLLAALVIAALLSILVTLGTGIGLYRGIAQIKSGLARLQEDFAFRLPERSDELGQISRSINQMSSVRRDLELQVRREDRLRAMGRLAAGIAHEIRNPLNSIRLTMQVLEQRLRSHTAGENDLEMVIGEVDRMNGLLTGLLDLQRTRPPDPKAQELRPVLERCVALVQAKASAQGTAIRLHGVGRGEAVFDDGQLTQVVVNLLLNALDASPQGHPIEVMTEQAGKFIQVMVVDGGPGLDEEEQEHLFEAFYSTKPQGTGLGLAVSRELMRAQKGDLVYCPRDHCSQDGGTAFVIRIPAGEHVEENHAEV